MPCSHSFELLQDIELATWSGHQAGKIDIPDYKNNPKKIMAIVWPISQRFNFVSYSMIFSKQQNAVEIK